MTQNIKSNKERKSKRTRKNVKNEEYYTDQNLALKLLEKLDDKIDLTKFAAFVEPSAGCGKSGSDSDDCGAFVNALNELLDKPNIIAYDINASPSNKKIKKADFLKVPDVPQPLKKYDPSEVLCIGNPPFGRKGKLAGKFIEKCAKFSDHIAFILPVSFLNQNGRLMDKYIPKEFHVKFAKRMNGVKFLDYNGESSKSSQRSKTSSSNGSDNDIDSDVDSDESSSCYCEGCEETKDKRRFKQINICFLYLKKEDWIRAKKKQRKIKPHHTYTILVKPDFLERISADVRVRGSGSLAGSAYGKCQEGFIVENKERSDDWFIKLKFGYFFYRTKLVKRLNEHYRKGKWEFFNLLEDVKYLNKDQLIKVVNKIMDDIVN